MTTEEKKIPLSWIRDLLNSHAAVSIVENEIHSRPKSISEREAISHCLPEFSNILEDRYDREK